MQEADFKLHMLERRVISEAIREKDVVRTRTEDHVPVC